MDDKYQVEFMEIAKKLKGDVLFFISGLNDEV